MNIDNLAGMTLGNRYDMLEKIGTGGMATVYKAKDTLLNRYVAIKILRESLEDEKNVVTNFIKEAQSSASLVHNNIVSVYDVGEENGLNYMVMEYVDGITLKEYIKQKGALPWQEACDFAIQIGQGINEAHSINIIHRDIKPQNILMTKDKILKVTDFGIARAVAGETTVVGGSALGSVHYISPEQARGGFTDARSDIYSLGIVLYEMLTGKVPFDGDTAVSVALMHLEKDPVNVKCVNLDIPTDLAYVTMKAISKEQHARYQNVQEFVDDLHAVLADEPLPSREEMYRKTLQDKDEVLTDEDDYSIDDIDVPDISIPDDEEIEELPARGRTKRKTEVKKKSRKQKKEDRIAVVLAISTVVVVALLALAVYFGLNMSKEAIVPDFSNMTVEEATTQAQKAGLKIADEIEYSLSDTVAENCVISQDPEPKKVVKKNSEIKLVVSIGSSGGNIAAPDVVNKLFDDAVAEIINAGLNYTVKEEESSEVPAGYVIRQTPLAGTKLNKDDIINLHISKGNTGSAQATPAGERVSVPSIIGLGRDQAEATLKANGLSLGNVSRKASSAPEGTVISQSPELGKNALKGSFVSIVLSRGEENTQTGENTPTAAPENPSGNNNSGQSNTNNSTGTSGSENGSSDNGGSANKTSTRTFTVKIPDTANDSVDVEIVANGRTIHSAVHSKDEGTVSVEITGSGTAEVQAYIDGSKISDKTINFN